MSGNVIDTLITVFKLDSKEFEKNMEKADSETGKVQKTMTDAEKANKKLSDSFVKLAKDVAVASVSLLAVRNIASGFTEAAQAAIDLKMLSETTNTSMKSLSTWGHAVVEAGGTGKAFYSSIANLNQGIQDLAITGDSSLSPAMRYLGMNFLDASRKAKPMDDILLGLSDKFAKLDKTRALDVGKRLGLDQGTIFLLMKGRKSVDEILERKKELAALDVKNAEAAIKYNVVLDETRAVMEHFYMGIGTAVLPVLSAFLKGFMAVVEFMADHKPFLYAFLAGLAILLWNTAAAAWAVVAPLVIAALPILGLAVAAGVLAAALAFLVDDLWEFAEGNDSVIGAVIQRWEDFKAWLMSIWNSISSAIGDFWESLRPPEWLMGILGHIADLAGSAFNFVGNANQAPTNSMSSTSIVGGSASSTTNNIKASANIHTQSTDAASIAKHTGSTLGDMLRSAVSQNDDGVEA